MKKTNYTPNTNFVVFVGLIIPRNIVHNEKRK